MPLATTGSVLTRQRQDMMDEGLREQARESKIEISFACDAIMNEQYDSYTASLDPPVGDPTAVYAPT